MTKFAEDVPLRRNLIETPGVIPGVSELVKSAAGPILIRPVICSPALKSPVKGEARKMSYIGLSKKRITIIYN